VTFQSSTAAAVALLQGPVFDTDARRAQGPVLRWIDRLLKAPPLGIAYGAVPAVPKDAVGRTALLNLLRSNLEMFSVCVDRCYDRDPRVATASFQVRRAAPWSSSSRLGSMGATKRRPVRGGAFTPGLLS
jgi:hypothetical protein